MFSQYLILGHLVEVSGLVHVRFAPIVLKRSAN